MSLLSRYLARTRLLCSRLGSLLLLFQRTPVIQMLFPEARLLSSAGVGEITTWAVATVIGLGAYDSVAGATTITQILPSAGATTVPATTGTALSFIFQVTGAPSTAGSWTVTGTLPNGLVHTNAKNNSTDSITGVPTQTGSFPITVKAWENSNFSGGSSTKSFTINVVQGASSPPVINTQPSSITINSGATTTLTVVASGTPTPTFQWYIGASGSTNNPISGATSASYTTPALTSNTNYWARATNSTGTADTNTATVSVRIPPTITSQPASTTINSGGTTTLTVTASGTSPTFQWYRGAAGVTTTPVSGATSASFKTPVLTANTTYWVRASNAAGNANSNAATVTVRIPPAITTQPASTSINSGETATFTVAASGSSPTFQWYLGTSPNTANPVSGATTNTFTTPALTASASYWVRASNAAGTANSNTATATVLIPPAITTQPLSTTINSGSSAALSVAASGTPSTFQWYLGTTGDTSQPIDGATLQSYTTPALTADASYWVRATNVKGTADSDTALITVIVPPAITTPPESVNISSGETATFTVAASGSSPAFQWYLGSSPDTSTPVSGATANTFTTSALTESASFWVRASNAAGVANSNTVTATVLIPPAITTQPLSTTINSGSSATLTVAASGTPSTFQWYLGTTGDTSQPIDGATLQTYTTPDLTANASYWVRATNVKGTADSDTALITVIVAPAITTPPESITIASGETATFTVTASGSSPAFQWYLGNSPDTSTPVSGATANSFTTSALTESASFWVRASNAVGVANSNTVTATVLIPPAITTQPLSTTINSGSSATLTVAASGSQPSFQWYLGISGDTSQPIDGANTDTFTSPALTANTSYWVRATNVKGTADSETALVTVIFAPVITTPPASVSVANGGTATFTVVATGTTPTFQWYLGNSPDTSNPLSGETSNTFTTPALTGTTAYWVRASNAAGNADSETVTATVLSPPAITTQPISTSIISGGTVTLTVAASGSSPTFQWYLGDTGDTSQPIDGATLDTFTTPALTTNTRYWVRASNSISTADSATASITIILVPSITSPPLSTSINSGGTATFTVSASGTSPTFQWYLGNSPDTSNPVSGATGETFTTDALTSDASYWVRASNAAGTADSATVTATVITPPELTSQPASLIIAQGTQATLTVTASGTTPTFQWYLGNTGDTTNPVVDATSATFTTPALTATTSYWVRATNAAGTDDSQTAVVTVLMPPTIISQPASVAVKMGKKATLQVSATGSSVKYQWYQGKAGVTTHPVPGAKSSKFITPAIKAPTSYWVRVTNSVGRVNSKTAVVTLLKASSVKPAAVPHAATATVTTGDPYTIWITTRLDAAQLADPDFSSPAADPDGDGVTNENEYLFGHDPLTVEPPPVPEIVATGNQLTLSFIARKATGPGYTGLSRHHTLEVSDAPDSPTWTALTGYSDIVGNDQKITCTIPATVSRQFYRISIRLEP